MVASVAAVVVATMSVAAMLAVAMSAAVALMELSAATARRWW